MTIKQILFSTLILIVSIINSNSLETESKLTTPISFSLDAKRNTLPSGNPIEYFMEKKIDGDESVLTILRGQKLYERLDANHGNPCIYFPEIKTLIINTDDLSDCQKAKNFIEAIEHTNKLAEKKQ